MAETTASWCCQQQAQESGVIRDTMASATMTRKEKKRSRQNLRREKYKHRIRSCHKQVIYSSSAIRYIPGCLCDELDDYYHESQDFMDIRTDEMVHESCSLDEFDARVLEVALKMDDILLNIDNLRRRKHRNNSHRKLSTKSVMVEKRCRQRLKDSEEPEINTTRELLKCVLTKKVARIISERLAQKICRLCLMKHQQYRKLKDNVQKELESKGLQRCGIQEQNTETAQDTNGRFVLNKATSTLPTEKRHLNILESLQYRDITPEDYDLLLQLDSDLKPKTLSTEKVLHIPTITIGSENIDDDCSICMEPFIPKQVVKVLPVCKHIFHETCITSWLTLQSTKCPLDQLEV